MKESSEISRGDAIRVGVTAGLWTLDWTVGLDTVCNGLLASIQLWLNAVATVLIWVPT